MQHSTLKRAYFLISMYNSIVHEPLWCMAANIWNSKVLSLIEILLARLLKHPIFITLTNIQQVVIKVSTISKNIFKGCYEFCSWLPFVALISKGVRFTHFWRLIFAFSTPCQRTFILFLLLRIMPLEICNSNNHNFDHY